MRPFAAFRSMNRNNSSGSTKTPRLRWQTGRKFMAVLAKDQISLCDVTTRETRP